MVATIAPVVHGESRSRYYLVLLLNALGGTISAATVGALAATVGLLLGAPWGTAGFIVVAGLALVYVVREATGLPVPVPDRHKQVPLWWRSFYSPPVAAFLYGLGLGVGYLTYLSYGTYFAVTVAAAATGDPLLGAILCAPFGLARALSVGLANRTAREPERPSGIDRIDALAETPLAGIANGAALAAVAAAAVTAVL
ncbi:MAG: hypothetical protein M3280_02480 [Actinomycetota bacterium]|nr:hypothetical protein [Actinomycetota bacterium]